jgi:putative methyltransferase
LYKISSSQFNYQYGDQIHFPYSIARLVAFLKTKKNIKNEFQFEKTFVFRDKLDDYLQRCKDSDILLCSCYVWNWEITTSLAKEVKKLNPNCLIIFGGPEVPDLTGNFFEKYPFVDIIVHGEGEYVIGNIFEEYLNKKDFSKTKGVETKDFRNESEKRITDLETLPSPYLTNTVWDLVEKIDGVKYIASWETNRGCPYQCTFCDWGSLTNAKMTKWSEEMLYEEIEWFGENKIVYIDCCDANFGIYQDRDLKIAKKLKEVALKTNYPERIRPAWAKFSSDKIIPIAKELQRGGLLRAVTLAVQSLDETTLEIVKRANIEFDKFSELTDTFRENGIPTYTELIMGMPGETLESWKHGLEVLVSDTKIGSIFIYNCGVFTNAPMNQPIYVKHHKIKKLRSPIYLAHSSIHDRGMPEYEEISIGAASFTLDDLKETYLYSWLVQAFSSLGIFEYISKYYNKNYNLKFMKFYEILLEFCRTQKSLFSDEYNRVIDYIDNGYSGKGWNHHDPKLGDIYWPIEEATWLRLTYSKKILLEETLNFLKFLESKQDFNTKSEILYDLVKFQLFLLTTRDDSKEIKSDDFEYNWKNFFTNNDKLIGSKNNYKYKNLVLEEDPILWGYEAIFYGRSSKKYKFHPESLQTETSANCIEI